MKGVREMIGEKSIFVFRKTMPWEEIFSPHTHKMVILWDDGCVTNPIVIISHYICVSNHHIIQPKLHVICQLKLNKVRRKEDKEGK